mmetsp:Transcript_15728/g.49492  ORF Transcript_15728/g.49492 Transcript_15728/m.49492 type:complete len:372 (-) Transcript_15728:718-1833(-)
MLATGGSRLPLPTKCACLLLRTSLLLSPSAQDTICRVITARSGMMRAKAKGTMTKHIDREMHTLIAQSRDSSSATFARKTTVTKWHNSTYREPRSQMTLSWFRQVRSCFIHSGQASEGNFLKLRWWKDWRKPLGSPLKTTEAIPMMISLPASSEISPSSSRHSALFFLDLGFPDDSKKMVVRRTIPAMSIVRNRPRIDASMIMLWDRTSIRGCFATNMWQAMAGRCRMLPSRRKLLSTALLISTWRLHQASSRASDRTERKDALVYRDSFGPNVSSPSGSLGWLWSSEVCAGGIWLAVGSGPKKSVSALTVTVQQARIHSKPPKKILSPEHSVFSTTGASWRWLSRVRGLTSCLRSMLPTAPPESGSLKRS